MSPASALAAAPTMSTPLTAQGSIVGTFQYMAPEQIEGEEADQRTDIFAFGAVLYEMVTGRKAFEGRSQASLMGAIMHADPPPILADQPLTPRALDRTVRKCLAKDPDERWQTAKDLVDDLKWISLETTSQEDKPFGAVSAPAGVTTRRGKFLWPAAALVCATAAVALAVVHFRETPPLAPVVTFSVPLPEGTSTGGAFLAISPDGSKLAFTLREADGNSFLWIRALDSVEPRRIPGTEGASFPFWPTLAPSGSFREAASRRLTSPAVRRLSCAG